MGFSERIVNDVKFENPGMVLLGHLVAIRHLVFEGKRALAYTLLDLEGNFVRFFGTGVLNAKIVPADLGSLTRITYLKEEPLDGGRTRKLFRVEFDRDNKVQAEAPRPVPAPAAQKDQWAGQNPEITDDDIPF